jgi:hypothetical protein
MVTPGTSKPLPTQLTLPRPQMLKIARKTLPRSRFRVRMPRPRLTTVRLNRQRLEEQSAPLTRT